MNAIKQIEAGLIDFIAAVTPWLAPLIPAYLVYNNMIGQLGYQEWISFVGAGAVEFLGLSAVHTAVTFWQWNDGRKTEQAPFWIAFGAGMFYVIIVLIVNAALDIWKGQTGVKILAHALLSLLSVDAAVIIAIRAQHARKLQDRKAAQDERKAERKAAQQSAKTETPAILKVNQPQSEPQAETSQPQAVNTASREVFLTQWAANGHKTVTALARELGVNERTAQYWVKTYGEKK